MGVGGRGPWSPPLCSLGSGGPEREGLSEACQALVELGRGPCSFGPVWSSGLFVYVCMYVFFGRTVQHAGS